jgi:hypothetical protein
MENEQLVSPSRQCSNTPVGDDQAFKEQLTTLEHSPYSTDKTGSS